MLASTFTSSLDDLKDAEWEFQDISNASDGLSWFKTNKYGDQRPAACKLNPLSSVPTKAQYGMQ